MRPASLIFVGLGFAALSACTSGTERVDTAPPMVSYRVTGSDVSQANLDASRYCQRYGTAAEYRGLQQTPSGNIAVYDCAGPQGSTGSDEPDVAAPDGDCASFLHQNQPGGSDYGGPPVAGCPDTR